MTIRDLLAGVAFSHVTSVPRPTADGDAANQRGGLFAAAVDAHASGRPIAVVWLRPSPAVPVEFFVSCAPVTAPDHLIEQPLLFPTGSRGTPVKSRALIEELARLDSWTPCTGLFDPLVAEQYGRERTALGTFEDYVSYLHADRFAWVVLGMPRLAAELTDDLRRLRLEIPSLRADAGNSEQARIDCERAEARYRELTSSRASGSWDVHVVAGGADATASRRVASLLCSGTDLVGLPYLLAPGDDPITLEADVQIKSADGASAPFLATTMALIAMARPPEKEVPGVRLATPSTFDVTPEAEPGTPHLPPGIPRIDGGGIVIGAVLDADLRPTSELRVSLQTLNYHTFVCGATGGGKSQTVRTLLEGLAAAGVPWLVIEPAKAEYAKAMAGRLGKDRVLVIRPGDPKLIASGLNPLEPAPGFPLQSHLDLVRALFLAAFQADEPFPQIVAQALSRCYEQRGWDLVTGEPRVRWASPGVRPRFPTLSNLQAAAASVVRDIGYSDKVASDMSGYVDVRIGSLRNGSPGRFFEGGHPLDIEALLRANVVLEIENITSDEDKAFLIGTVLLRLFEHLRVRAQAEEEAGEGEDALRHLTVVEEAHRLLRNVEHGRSTSHAIELFANLLAEVRAYHEGILVAEQIPSKLLPDVIKNTACKIVHRLPAADDRAVVGATMNMTQAQSEYVVSLRPGTAAVFTDGMDRPVLATMPNHKSREQGGPKPNEVPPLGARPLATCPVSCEQHPCTLGRIAAAESLLREHADLELWADLLVMGHIAGYTGSPVPKAEWKKQLFKICTPEVLACALSRAASRAVDARQRWLVDLYQPEVLGSHVVQIVGDVLSGAKVNCTTAGCAQFQAGQQRWADVQRDLQACKEVNRPHPKTADWYERGLDVRDIPAAQQRTVVSQIAAANSVNQLELELGGKPSRIGTLVRRIAGLMPTDAAVTRSLDVFETKSVEGWIATAVEKRLANEWPAPMTLAPVARATSTADADPPPDPGAPLLTPAAGKDALPSTPAATNIGSRP